MNQNYFQPPLSNLAIRLIKVNEKKRSLLIDYFCEEDLYEPGSGTSIELLLRRTLVLQSYKRQASSLKLICTREHNGVDEQACSLQLEAHNYSSVQVRPSSTGRS